MKHSLSWALTLIASLAACAGERRVHPPPEGEWLEWEPKPEGQTKKKPTTPDLPSSEPVSKKPAAKHAKPDDAEDLDASPATSKPAAAATRCNGKNLTREALCVALSELDAKECPAKLPKTAAAKDAGAFELPPNGARRDPSREASSKQCCYAWCAKVPAARPPTACKSPEPLFCFEAPAAGVSSAAPPPYADCPGGLEKTAAKGRRKAVPRATFSAKRTKEERAGEPAACCYDACK
ncbi:MAG: hypothetical protein IT377_26440 [Polyangiaceae bacterium]|nr:hypothetical protein [Polyangiaceae bacterium]